MNHSLIKSKKINKEILIKEVKESLLLQGYTVRGNSFSLLGNDRVEKKAIHKVSRAERINNNIKFIESFLPKAEQYMRNSDDINIENIDPKIIEIKTGSFYNDLFRWWNLVWWSLPYEKAYGRQMRFLIWDKSHNMPIGLIGLQSPILRWRVRDNYLGIKQKDRDYWINQSLNSQRLGALPPYNKFLGGKLVALLMTSDDIRESFYKKYKGRKTLLLDRKIPSNLLFITTTGAYGKSSVYNRLKFNNDKICDFIGYTNGSGSFHIPNTLYEGFVMYLKDKGFNAGRGFGNGPSVKMKIISKAMGDLGFKNGSNHGIKRAVYLFPLVKNIEGVINNKENPIYHNRSPEDLTEYWKEKWLLKRTQNYPKEKIYFSKKDYISELQEDLEECKKLFSKNNE